MIRSDIEVELIDCMGSDLTVVNSARVSMDKRHDKLVESLDEKLIRYLAKHEHWSPFAHPQLQFRIKAPVFVARQLVKHHVGMAWNEVSRRYVDGEPEFYLPELRARADNVKQGSADHTINNVDAVNAVVNLYNMSLSTYHTLLDLGVAPEVARSVLPVAHMTEWYWTGSLYAFCRMLNLRLDAHAQKECRLVAAMIAVYVRDKFPLSYKYLVKEGK